MNLRFCGDRLGWGGEKWSSKQERDMRSREGFEMGDNKGMIWERGLIDERVPQH